MKIKYTMLCNNRKNTGGYTLLFAVLISSVVLGIGISILNISKKELLISTSARDSSAAFYAADSGIECAIYSEQQDSFDTTTQDPNPVLHCNVPYSFDPPVYGPTEDEGTFVFHMKSGSADLNDPNALASAGKSCVVVTVKKFIDSTGRVKTQFDSRGYNTGWRPTVPPTATDAGKCNLGSVKRVERGLSYAKY